MSVKTAPERVTDRELTQFLSYRIIRVHQVLNAQAVAVLDKVAGISLTQWRLIAMIGSGTASTARDIARKTFIDPGMISRTSRALEDAGLITTTRPSADRRIVEMRLTDKGHAIFARTLPYMQARQQALLDSLEPEEQDAVFGILEKLEAAGQRREFTP